MTGRRLLRALRLGLPAGLAAAAAVAQADTVGVCFDEADHTPYLFRDATGQWRGATLDLARAALARAGYTLKALPMPWSRCVREVEEFGSRRSAEMLLYASLNPERERKFLASVPVHQIQGGFWYSSRHRPQADLPRSWVELARYRLCGMFGHNYAWLAGYGISQIDSGALNLRAVLEKLERGRCDFVLSALEPVRGAAQLGFVQLPAELAFLPYPDRGPISQHLLLTRQSPRVADLHSRLNQALQALQANGEADRIYQGYLPDGDGLR
ncbi:polar amino acid transport system substrate-binding protein [Inhella inkyongensis]|uniref:Polar amino acid transport system substrate-binding protein n=1 Tax=Inhella inkyongensis TaxID=392593 RepID=A0A840SBH6_9BURK|nr:transporter substrate-binding domain-containing protein [Inhella inkyongensis]MBB5206356.1 polar amino acid transport system substrate-binding protein [Inhella inkyongensis]